MLIPKVYKTLGLADDHRFTERLIWNGCRIALELQYEYALSVDVGFTLIILPHFA
jgi:hypothetical protein